MGGDALCEGVGVGVVHSVRRVGRGALCEEVGVGVGVVHSVRGVGRVGGRGVHSVRGWVGWVARGCTLWGWRWEEVHSVRVGGRAKGTL